MALLLVTPNLATALDGQPAESLQEKVTRIAVFNGISPEKLANLVEGESNWNPQAVGDKGCSYGLVQINLCVHKNVTKEQALDPEYALEWATMRFKEGKDWHFTVCSCARFASVVGANIPLKDAADFIPNGNPRVGGLVLMKYGKVHHVAVITKLESDTMTIREANYKPCATGSREISYTDKAIIGFWNP